MNVLLTDLFTTDIGLLSLAVIVFIIGMAIYLFCYVREHVRLDTEAHQQEEERVSQRKG